GRDGRAQPDLRRAPCGSRAGLPARQDRRGDGGDARHSAGYGQVAHLLCAPGPARGPRGKPRRDGTVSIMNARDSANSTSDHVDIAGYLMETLSPEEKQRVEEHLAECAECRSEVESLREWTAALRAVPEPMRLDGPPDDADLLLQRTLRQVRDESSGRRHRRTAMVTSAAAAVIAAAIA